jgi:toxin ParE1/3/4
VVALGWTAQALDDLEAACLYIARDAPHIAQIFAARAFDATDRLADFPLSGRVVAELGRKDIREVIVYGYRIIYRYSDNELAILTIHHGARPLPKDFG